MTDDGAITLHAFIRPGTPTSVASHTLVAQLAELYEFGVIGPGNRVWCNFDIPNALWVLAETSTFLRVVDVPVAGYVRLTRRGMAWGRVARDTTDQVRVRIERNELPIDIQQHDEVTVAFRNGDDTLMRVQHTGDNHDMVDYESYYKGLRVIDFKINGRHRKTPPEQPSEFDRNQAGVRGLDLMCATVGPAMHRFIRENLDAFTNRVDVGEFARIKAAQERLAQLTERVTDPIVHNIADLDSGTLFRGGPESEDDEDASGAA